MSKRAIATLFVAWASCLILSAQTNNDIREQYKPGKLETFLMMTPNASIAQKNIGTLSAATSAAFTAIVVTDPVTRVRASGLEVHFSGVDLADSIYLDEDCLVRLQKSLASLEAQRLYLAQHGPDHDSADLPTPRIVMAYNDYSTITLPDGRTEKAGVLSLGYYEHGGRFGVYLAPTKSKARQNLQSYFPEATLVDLSRFLEEAQSFLVSAYKLSSQERDDRVDPVTYWSLLREVDLLLSN